MENRFYGNKVEGAMKLTEAASEKEIPQQIKLINENLELLDGLLNGIHNRTERVRHGDLSVPVATGEEKKQPIYVSPMGLDLADFNFRLGKLQEKARGILEGLEI